MDNKKAHTETWGWHGGLGCEGEITILPPPASNPISCFRNFYLRALHSRRLIFSRSVRCGLGFHRRARLFGQHRAGRTIYQCHRCCYFKHKRDNWFIRSGLVLAPFSHFRNFYLLLYRYIVGLLCCEYGFCTPAWRKYACKCSTFRTKRKKPFSRFYLESK